ncbi:hypothetical protein LINPERPRIM_LOCUS11792 [Linum perenne]
MEGSGAPPKSITDESNRLAVTRTCSIIHISHVIDGPHSSCALLRLIWITLAPTFQHLSLKFNTLLGHFGKFWRGLEGHGV